ncbi:MAG: hypothetical protein PSV18_15860 [Methylobacter sp.]|nr:hypothetical protein [Candidatus Methylobacter titanis]
MFTDANWVFKNGDLVVKNGLVQQRLHGRTQTIQAQFDFRIRREIQAYYDRFYNLSLDNFAVGDVSFNQTDGERFVMHNCGQPYHAISGD